MAVELPSYIAGEAVRTDRWRDVHYPWDNSLTGRVAVVGPEHLDQAIHAAIKGQKQPLTRYQRHDILRKAAALLAERREELAQLICRESGLCMQETRSETGRSSDVLEFAAIEALQDDGQIFSCDISPQGKARKIFTFRQPVQLVSAITPLNHPLNQVAHKVAPAIAAGAPMLLKPSEKNSADVVEVLRDSL
ncbi:MAG: aldehyde dehydrogenase family protein [Planctomycetaceae bacterium]